MNYMQIDSFPCRLVPIYRRNTGNGRSDGSGRRKGACGETEAEKGRMSYFAGGRWVTNKKES